MLRNKILFFLYPGLSKIISGGQCGADRGGLEAAKDSRIETGGTAPRGYRTHYGPAPELVEFGLVEHYSTDYTYRTEANVLDSDGTLIIATDLESPGVNLTRRLCHKHKKPFFTVRPSDGLEPSDITKFIIENDIQVLNVAGNRDKQKSSTFHHDYTYDMLESVFIELDEVKKLIRKK